jgi:hypothetical protein
MSFCLRKLSNSLGEVSVTVGTTADGAAPAGTGVAFVRGAARAGVVRPGGTGGAGQARPREYVRLGRAGRELVRRRQIVRDSNVRYHSLPRGHDLEGPRVQGGGSHGRVHIGVDRLEEPCG